MGYIHTYIHITFLKLALMLEYLERASTIKQSSETNYINSFPVVLLFESALYQFVFQMYSYQFCEIKLLFCSVQQY